MYISLDLSIYLSIYLYIYVCIHTHTYISRPVSDTLTMLSWRRLATSAFLPASMSPGASCSPLILFFSFCFSRIDACIVVVQGLDFETQAVPRRARIQGS